MLDVGDGLTDRDVIDPRQADDVARRGFLDLDPLQTVEGVELGDAHFLDPCIQLAHRHRVADAHAAVEDAADGDSSDIVARIEVGDQQLQRRVRITTRRRHVLDNRVEQRSQVCALGVCVPARRPGPGVGVEDGEIELLIVGVEIDEEIVDLVQHLLRTRVGPVDFVDDHNRGQPALERLAEHEPRLRQRSLGCIDEQHHSVHHRQGALDLAAEVGMARRIDDVDEQVVIVDGRVLGQDGDAALALEVGIVHRALGHPLVGAERAALMQQRVDEGGLTVIHMRDDGHVTTERIGHLSTVWH